MQCMYKKQQVPGGRTLWDITFRWVNVDDVVPNVPGDGAGFQHVGRCGSSGWVCQGVCRAWGVRRWRLEEAPPRRLCPACGDMYVACGGMHCGAHEGSGVSCWLPGGHKSCPIVRTACLLAGRRYWPVKATGGGYSVGEEAAKPTDVPQLALLTDGFEPHKFKTYVRALRQWAQQAAEGVAAKDMCGFNTHMPPPQPVWAWKISIKTAWGLITGTDGDVKVAIACGGAQMTNGALGFKCGQAIPLPGAVAEAVADCFTMCAMPRSAAWLALALGLHGGAGCCRAALGLACFAPHKCRPGPGRAAAPHGCRTCCSLLPLLCSRPSFLPSHLLPAPQR